jgi:hypothetical protein
MVNFPNAALDPWAFDGVGSYDIDSVMYDNQKGLIPIPSRAPSHAAVLFVCAEVQRAAVETRANELIRERTQAEAAAAKAQENFYKAHCEQENTLPKTWEEDWIQFVLSVKGKSMEESESIIKAFVENLRRIRHNALCAKDTVERDDRQQWPSHVVVRAFLEGKLDKFKAFTESYTNEKPEEPKWVKRWSDFVVSLEQNRENEETLKNLCSKFMTAQRTKKYRAKK